MSKKLPLYAVDKCPVRLWLPAETYIKLERRSEESGLPIATIVTAMVIEAVKDDPVRLRNVRWEMNCNDYTRIMREKMPIAVGTPRFAELQAAAKRILEDWKRYPSSANVSEEKKVREDAERRIRALAACDPKAGGTVDLDKIP